jgi:hypothetical protein
MAFSDEVKLEQIKGLFIRRINEVPTLPDMIQLIKNISPAMIKTFLLPYIETARLERLNNATHETELAADLEALKSEVGNL